MPSVVLAPPQIVEATKNAAGRIIRVGTKPWAYFKGVDSEARASLVIKVFVKLYGYEPIFAGKPWRDDQKEFDYAIRLDP